MSSEAEHQVEVADLGGAWQRGHRLLQATCTCGWQGKREFQPREAAEAEAESHLRQQEREN